METQDRVSRVEAVAQIRSMAMQFADLYFCFVQEIRVALGDEAAREMVRRVLFQRARERAAAMVARAQAQGIERTPENMPRVSDIAYMGWAPAPGREHCPFGVAWNARIAQYPWFREYARMYCDVMDTTVAEAFTGNCSHKLLKNIVLGDESCERVYYPDEAVKDGHFTYGEPME
ncbi:MAG TPA: hypothetical protein IAA64_01655 [Candidatus Ornithocaccomicrobium faecavium]|uniref:L-2-amino-thiazoline-4-carboxylic acid hydrolase n=1 Tax=Candidatus Ornithocaccomicrobium faecavium TaxID=2840890 RepID=A0A9D1TB96_9FIRM|nr:hypothetical protein [Candidatus Ornithocaccomicrobium faecavium]